jgi:hypothetical protein
LLAVHVATPENVGQIAVGGLVDQFRCRAWLAMLEYADNHTGATLFFRAAAFDADFHANLLNTMDRTSTH